MRVGDRAIRLVAGPPCIAQLGTNQGHRKGAQIQEPLLGTFYTKTSTIQECGGVHRIDACPCISCSRFKMSSRAGRSYVSPQLALSDMRTRESIDGTLSTPRTEVAPATERRKIWIHPCAALSSLLGDKSLRGRECSREGKLWTEVYCVKPAYELQTQPGPRNLHLPPRSARRPSSLGLSGPCLKLLTHIRHIGINVCGSEARRTANPGLDLDPRCEVQLSRTLNF